ncbi:peptide deformylase [Roseburia amylophila]|uniref:Peptide deformylase n=1 Tax=Roseburia amylophila TaxID=2981794 RepID=A0ABT2SG25_9FIRM|nr:peptide deformylase [Roseburia amylophila]MCU6717963.1 peptide deformylase [Roseburia amylophila]
MKNLNRQRNTGTAKSRRQCQRRLCSRPISICNGESGDYEEVRRLQYRGKLSFAGWSQSLHKRYQEIEVDYLNSDFKPQHGKYSGFTAQVIQHEIDHCNGVVI